MRSKSIVHPIENDVAEQIVAAKQGCRDALGQLAQSCRRYLLSVANQELDRGLRPKFDASDAVQDTFLIAHYRFTQFLGCSEAELRGWLRRILLHILANLRRDYCDSGKRQITREVALDVFWGGGGLGTPVHHLPAKTPGPSNHAIRREQDRLLEGALDRLPEHLRQVILLRNRDYHSFREIGRRLHRSEEAVRKLWERAVRQIRREIGMTLPPRRPR